ncbi:hypothetical protein F1737_02975 [Methanoplanus sp. FWC-SCC4]|uniref:Uncharacterized protein n=1 Tax=Methanochimaera problematica TaxID=2609417 RepID=A0AA97FA83_9EURY|nr:hypothetical protein [Methanoplanus sp. FWC-SCC4]WOF15725.1 hypothetical protein F1737_02975 [Methanoplanus sp. FWC-SCC4]
MSCLKPETVIIFLSIFFALLILPFVVSAGDGTQIWGYVNPEGDLAPGQETFVHYTVQYDFDSDAESLQLYTDLLSPKWQFATVIDGARQEMPKRFGRYETISGFQLYYPRTYQTQVEVNLTGTVPEVSGTANYSVLEVIHYNAVGEEVSKNSVEKIFINPGDLDILQNRLENDLESLRKEIDILRETGADVKSAKIKYLDALNAISAAKYSETSQKSSYLSLGHARIDEAKSILDVESAKNSIDKVKRKVESVDSMVDYFENNKGLLKDSRVWVIKSYNDNARTILVLAEDKFLIKNYDQTRIYADQAAKKADEAYSYAISLNNKLGLDVPTPDNSNLIPAATKNHDTQNPSNSVSITNTGELDDIDEILHSDVNVESFLKILGKTKDMIFDVMDFLNDLMALASDN